MPIPNPSGSETPVGGNGTLVSFIIFFASVTEIILLDYSGGSKICLTANSNHTAVKDFPRLQMLKIRGELSSQFFGLAANALLYQR